MRRRRLAALLVLPAIAVVGCGGGKDVVLEPAPGTGWLPPLIEPLPLRLSYVFEPSVDQEVTFSAVSSGTHLRLGPATRAIFERTLPALVESARAGPPRPGDNGSLTIALLGVEVTKDAWSLRNYVVAWSVDYGITFVDPDGTDIGTWKISGATVYDGSEEALAQTLRGATAELVRSFAVQPAIVAWLTARREAMT